MQVVRENESFVTEFVLVGWSGRPKSRMVLMTFFITAYLITVFGNGLIILVTVSDPRLHSPMYFFLCNLSIVDFCFMTTAVPQSIANCLVDMPVMSFRMCFTQLITSTFFGTTECFLLVVMAYDRYIAISNPLQYILIMNKSICILLAISTWTTAFIVIVIPCITMPLRFCGNNRVDHLGCELKAVFKLLCENVDFYQIVIYVAGILILVAPLSFILFSYVRIVVAILRMHSKGSRMKAFSTCGSHLTVVALFFGTTIFAYIIPQSKETEFRDKVITILYAMVTPMCNPLIYTLRNREILEAVKRLMSKKGGVLHR